jgi:hypothetical protein
MQDKLDVGSKWKAWFGTEDPDDRESWLEERGRGVGKQILALLVRSMYEDNNMPSPPAAVGVL